MVGDLIIFALDFHMQTWKGFNSTHTLPPARTGIYRDERKEMMKSEGYGSATNIWMVQWKAPGFFWMKMVALGIKNGTWEMSGWTLTLIPAATFSRCHLPEACHPSQRAGAQILCVGIPSVSCLVLGMQIVLSGTGLSPEDWQGRTTKKWHWPSLCGLWGSTGPMEEWEVVETESESSSYHPPSRSLGHTDSLI